MNQILPGKSGIDPFQASTGNTLSSYIKIGESEDRESINKGETKKTKKGFQSILETISPDNQPVIPSEKTEISLLEQPPVIFYNGTSGSSILSETSGSMVFPTDKSAAPMQNTNQPATVPTQAPIKPLTQEDQTILAAASKDAATGQFSSSVNEGDIRLPQTLFSSSLENKGTEMEEDSLFVQTAGQPSIAQAASGSNQSDNFTEIDPSNSGQQKTIQNQNGMNQSDNYTLQETGVSGQLKTIQEVDETSKASDFNELDASSTGQSDKIKEMKAKNGSDKTTIQESAKSLHPKDGQTTDIINKTDNSTIQDQTESIQTKNGPETNGMIKMNDPAESETMESVPTDKKIIHPSADTMLSQGETENSIKQANHPETDKAEAFDPLQIEKGTDSQMKKGETNFSDPNAKEDKSTSVEARNGNETSGIQPERFVSLIQKEEIRQNNPDTSFQEAEVTETTLKDFKASPLAEKMVKSIQYLQKSPDGDSLIIRLKPEQYGELHIRITQHGTAIHADIHTNDPSMQALLAENVNQLKEGLSRQGILCDQVNINFQASSQENTPFQNSQDQSSRQQANEPILKTNQEGKQIEESRLHHFYQRDQGRINLLA